MWKCHKCGKPVYFAERKQSLGYDWHPECLRCEECGKRLNPGQHAEHKGVPYCHVPCYGALFGPQLFGHGTRVESHKSFGQKSYSRVNSGPSLPRSHLETKLKTFNQFYDSRAGEIRSREVNGRLVLEGALRIHWGVRGLIHLKEDDDQRTVVTVRKRNSCRISTHMISEHDLLISNLEQDDSSEKLESVNNEINTVEKNMSEVTLNENTDKCPEQPIDLLIHKNLTLPSKLDVKNLGWDELDELLQVERKVDESDKLYQTMPNSLILASTHSSSDSSSTTTTPAISNQSSVESPTTESSFVLNGSSKDEDDKKFKDYDEKTLVPQRSEKESRQITQDDSWIEKGLNRSMSGPDCLERTRYSDSDTDCDDSLTQEPSSPSEVKPRHGSTAIRRRPGARRSRTKIKRRCSINGHFYDRETSIFTPPHGSQMSVWVTSLVNTQEVINLMLEKYKVDSAADNFALFVVRDSGEQRRLREDEYPLLVRVLLGPHEDVAKLFIFDRHSSDEVSSEVAQFLNLSLVECRAILQQYKMQEDKEVQRILAEYEEIRKRIKQRKEELKVRL